METPSSPASLAGIPISKDVSLLQLFFDQHGSIKFLRMTVVDFASVPRVYVIPKRAALNIAKKGYSLTGTSSFISTFTPNSATWDNIDMGFDELIPDWSSLRPCTYYTSHANVFCFCRQQQEGKPNNGFSLDPRSALVKQVDNAAKQNLSFLVGHEIEFLLSEAGTKFDGSPPYISGYATCSLRKKFTPVVDEIVTALEEAGINVNKYHSEDLVDGFYEVVLEPLPPVEAADALVYSHETIKTIAQRHDLLATVSPHPYESGINIAGHVNISVNSTDNQTAIDDYEADMLDDDRREDATHFFSGLLTHFRALCAFGMPRNDSYARRTCLREWIQWMPGGKACVINQRRHNLWELRNCDGTANPYLNLAGIIAAGLHGIREKIPRPVKGNSDMVKNRGLPDEKVREELGIREKLPESLPLALDLLQKDKMLGDDEFGLGEELVRRYLIIKRKENGDFAAMKELDRRLAMMKVF